MPPSNKKKQLNSIVCDTNINNINIEIQKDKPIDNFFGTIIDKPPSPINILLNETQNINQQSNTYLDIAIENTEHFIPKNVIYSNVELKKKIELLSEDEMCEIFRIIKNNKEKYSTNNNGIFINLSALKLISIKEISSFLSFCENNNKILKQEEEQRELYRDLVSEN